jgi:hypothetical protein
MAAKTQTPPFIVGKIIDNETRAFVFDRLIDIWLDAQRSGCSAARTDTLEAVADALLGDGASGMFHTAMAEALKR